MYLNELRPGAGRTVQAMPFITFTRYKTYDLWDNFSAYCWLFNYSSVIKLCSNQNRFRNANKETLVSLRAVVLRAHRLMDRLASGNQNIQKRCWRFMFYYCTDPHQAKERLEINYVTIIYYCYLLVSILLLLGKFLSRKYLLNAVHWRHRINR